MFRKKTSANSGGFFEVFSDLIFGVMAIFVLLFVIILSQINPKQKSQPAVDLVVAIDVSASMGEPLVELKQSLAELTENFPTIIRDFRVGVVLFASWVAPSGIQQFPLTEMDNVGKTNLLDWLDDVQQQSGYVDTILGIETAIEMMGASPGEERRRSLVIIGDVGPFELRDGQQLRANTRNAPVDTRFADQGVSIVRSFAQASEENRVLVFFPNQADYTFEGEDYTRWGFGESKDFFCDAAKSAGAKGEFINRDGKLMWSLMSTFLTVEDLEGKEGAVC